MVPAAFWNGNQRTWGWLRSTQNKWTTVSYQVSQYSRITLPLNNWATAVAEFWKRNQSFCVARSRSERTWLSKSGSFSNSISHCRSQLEIQISANGSSLFSIELFISSSCRVNGGKTCKKGRNSTKFFKIFSSRNQKVVSIGFRNCSRTTHERISQFRFFIYREPYWDGDTQSFIFLFSFFFSPTSPMQRCRIHYSGTAQSSAPFILWTNNNSGWVAGSRGMWEPIPFRPRLQRLAYSKLLLMAQNCCMVSKRPHWIYRFFLQTFVEILFANEKEIYAGIVKNSEIMVHTYS